MAEKGKRGPLLLGVILPALFIAQPGFAQTSEELKAVRQELEALKGGAGRHPEGATGDQDSPAGQAGACSASRTLERGPESGIRGFASSDYSGFAFVGRRSFRLDFAVCSYGASFY